MDIEAKWKLNTRVLPFLIGLLVLLQLFSPYRGWVILGYQRPLVVDPLTESTPDPGDALWVGPGGRPARRALYPE